ncbi:MAG: hypothetical protein KDI82_01120 [Gammaproteobacteria bacterium]|nr:hypothetical protein [Gammaproteobacteria bacterium]
MQVLKHIPKAFTILVVLLSLGLVLLVVGCASNDVGAFFGALAPKNQMLTTYGGNAPVQVPTTYRLNSKPFATSKQTWHFKYFGSWAKSVPDPTGWSMFVKPGPTLQPGEMSKVVNGKPMVCGNKANDALHPMHDYYFVLSSGSILVRNAKPTDFLCDKTFQDIWNYIDSAPGLKPGQTVLHSQCMVEFIGGLTQAGFTPDGPFACRFILNHYKKNGEDRANIEVTVYTETDKAIGGYDAEQLKIDMNDAWVKYM